MSDKNVSNCQSSISLCQPSCGYYFSSGLVISETVYSSASHGAIYNAASRIIIDGGRKFIQTTAIAGMLGQNFVMPAKAAVISINKGETVTYTDTYNLLYGDTVYVRGTVISADLMQNTRMYISSGGVARSTWIGMSGSQTVYKGGQDVDGKISSGIQYISSGGVASKTIINAGEQKVSNNGRAVDVKIYGGQQSVLSGGTAKETQIK